MKHIKIFDTTLRDGQQGIGSNMTPRETKNCQAS